MVLNIIKWEKSVWRSYMIYYFKYMTFWKKRVYNNGEETSDWEDFKDGQRVD